MRTQSKPSKSEYLGLLVYEALLVQEIEIHSKISGNEGEVQALKEDKAAVSIKRKRMKMRIKNMQQVRPTLTANIDSEYRI